MKPSNEPVLVDPIVKRKPITKCIFCSSANLTGEHIFSKWLHKYLGPRPKNKSLSFSGREYPDGRKEPPILRKMRGQMRDWKVYCVCGGDSRSCNNGWMRALENSARPLLIPLINGEEGFRISPKDQGAISAWAILKAIVGEYDSRLPTTVHHKQRKYIREHGSPPLHGWGVWIGRFERKDFIPEWISRPFLLLPDEQVTRRRKSFEATFFNSCASSQIINKLFIQVVHSPHPRLASRWRFTLPKGGTLVRVWPPTDISILWSLSALGDIDAEMAGDAVARMVLEAGRHRIASAADST